MDPAQSQSAPDLPSSSERRCNGVEGGIEPEKSGLAWLFIVCKNPFPRNHGSRSSPVVRGCRFEAVDHAHGAWGYRRNGNGPSHHEHPIAY